MAGLVPAIPIVGARQCQVNRDARDKPAHDESERAGRVVGCQRRHRGANVDHDFIIVDGGSAGCVMANRLSAHAAHSVLLLRVLTNLPTIMIAEKLAAHVTAN
jgi:hypothetical protein